MSPQEGILEDDEPESSPEPETPQTGPAPILKRGDSPRELDNWAKRGVEEVWLPFLVLFLIAFLAMP